MSVGTYNGKRAGHGVSYSGAQPSVGTLGTLLATLPANPLRAYAVIQNQSAGDLTLVFDKGDEVDLRTFIVTGVGANQQGGDWSSEFFLGRIRIYGASGARFSAEEF